jgi:hypothetical protein
LGPSRRVPAKRVPRKRSISLFDEKKISRVGEIAEQGRSRSLGQRPELRAGGVDPFEDGEQVFERAGEAVEFPHDERVAGAELVEKAVKLGAVPATATKEPAMKKHEILSPQSRAVLFDPPTDPAEIVRHYTFSPEDLALIRRRRRDANRLGFAVHLAYLRFPGRARSAAEVPPANMLGFIADQLGCELTALDNYARREETRWEHLGELQAYLGVRPFLREDYRAVTKVAIEQATGTDRGHAIVSAMITDLRQRGASCRRLGHWNGLPLVPGPAPASKPIRRSSKGSTRMGFAHFRSC